MRAKGEVAAAGLAAGIWVARAVAEFLPIGSLSDQNNNLQSEGKTQLLPPQSTLGCFSGRDHSRRETGRAIVSLACLLP